MSARLVFQVGVLVYFCLFDSVLNKVEITPFDPACTRTSSDTSIRMQFPSVGSIDDTVFF